MLWHKGHAPAFNGDRKKGPRPTQLDTSTFLSTNVLPCLSSHVFTKSELQNKPLCNKITLFLLKVLLATTQGPSTRRRTAVLPQYCSNKNKRVGTGASRIDSNIFDGTWVGRGFTPLQYAST